MNKKLIAASFLAMGAGFVSLGAVAADHPRGDGSRFEKLDANDDGELSFDEMTSKQAELLSEADADGNGSISKEEMRAHYKAKREERNPDKNKDGAIDRTEFINAAQDRFDRLDENGDGVLDEDERPRKKRRGR